MKLSALGRRLTGESGTLSLMEDLGALAGNKDIINLGGGNPSHIPAVEAIFRARLQALLQRPGGFESAVGEYGGPTGDSVFAAALAELLGRELGWPVGPENICVTNGSQSAFFLLFNMLAGPGEDGRHRRILLPLAPEYIGYGDVGLSPDLFVSYRPTIDFLEGRLFKYRVDFSRLVVGPDVAALCVSRPTNPTGNVLTDEEVAHLRVLAAEAGVPLILDNAYGMPFPHIIFTDASPVWDDNTIVCMSLSKLGLPGLRAGIVVADSEVVRALGAMNAILSLAPGGLGPALITELCRTGEVLRISRSLIEPHYRARVDNALALLSHELSGYDVFIHKPEGAFFLWLWCRGLPIKSAQLYERLKARGVIVVSGHYFFPGLDDAWRHRDECLRISYADDPAKVERGLRIVAEEVRAAYDGASRR